MQEKLWHIQELIAEANFSRALKELRAFLKNRASSADQKAILSDVIFISAKYHKLKQDFQTAMVTYEQFEAQHNRILKHLLDVIIKMDTLNSQLETDTST